MTGTRENGSFELYNIYMVKVIPIIALLFSSNLFAQSPYLNIEVKMDRYMSEQTNYRIAMKICDPVKKTDKGDWFTKDTSAIDFLHLKTDGFNCGDYTYIEGKDDYAGGGISTKFNLYQFGNQVFAWEKLLVFRIANYSSRGWQPEMYVVLPMKYKAFLSHVELTDINFESGKVIYLSDPVAYYAAEGSRLTIEQSLRNEKLIALDNFPLKDILLRQYK